MALIQRNAVVSEPDWPFIVAFLQHFFSTHVAKRDANEQFCATPGTSHVKVIGSAAGFTDSEIVEHVVVPGSSILIAIEADAAKRERYA